MRATPLARARVLALGCQSELEHWHAPRILRPDMTPWGHEGETP